MNQEMDTADPGTAADHHLQTWAEICARYPEQYVCLVDIEKEEPGNPTIKAACVVGHGATDDEAFEPIRGMSAKFRRFAVRFTGIPKGTLTRPSLIIDDETLAILQS
jgi:hypothetical protein